MNTIELTKQTPVKIYDDEMEPRKIANRIKHPRNKKIKFQGNPPSGVVYHEGFFNYLAMAWEKHYSAVIRPDDIWYMILNEITAVIAKSPDEYSSLFTTTPGEKQLILVPTNSVEKIDPDLVIEELKSRVPSNVGAFLPKFSTTTPAITLAMNVSFCDAVSPYYSYGTFMCGIPNVRIEGTQADWQLLLTSIKNLSELFKGNLGSYLDRCHLLVGNIVRAATNSDAEFFKTMVKLEPCGSGHQFDMSGWILGFRMKNDGLTQLEGLPPHFARMDYFNLETDRKFCLFCGLFYSQIVDGFLVPEYDAVSYEILPEEKKSQKEEFKIISVPVGNNTKKLSGDSTMEPGYIYAPYATKFKD